MVTIEAKNNISALSPEPLEHTVTVIDDIGNIEVQLHPERAVSGDLVISTYQDFEITVSTSIKQEVTFTFKFSQNFTSDPVVAPTGRTKITHKYEKETNFTVEITASVTRRSEKRSFHVIARACGPPSLFFPDKYTSDDPQVTTKATASFQLEPRVTKNSCNKGALHFHWNMLSLEASEKPYNKTLDERVFPIDPKSLEPTNYSISLNVEYVENRKVITGYSFKTYMRVERSSLVAVIEGGSLRQIDANSSEWLTLNAAGSYDPDSSGNDDNLAFHWYCKLETNSNKSLSNGHCNLSSFVSLLASENRSANFKISEFLVNDTYIFNVTIISEDGRSASATQAVTIIPGIPSLEIR